MTPPMKRVFQTDVLAPACKAAPHLGAYGQGSSEMPLRRYGARP